MNIDLMTLDDYDEVFALWKATQGLGISASDTREATERYLKRNPGMCFVARADGRIVGTVLCGHEGRRGYLTHLAVALTHRRQGIGKQLVERCVAALQREGILGCNLFVLDSNAKGKEFWESLGWKASDGWGVMSRRF